MTVMVAALGCVAEACSLPNVNMLIAGALSEHTSTVLQLPKRMTRAGQTAEVCYMAWLAHDGSELENRMINERQQVSRLNKIADASSDPVQPEHGIPSTK